MGLNLPSFFQRCLDSLCHAVKRRLRRWTKPDNQSLALNTALDLTRSKLELVLQNALLRQQLIVPQRQGKRPTLTWRERALFVLMASKLPSWKTALMIVQPDTLLRWHRELFRRVWRRKSRRKGEKGRQPLAGDVVALIKTMASHLLGGLGQPHLGRGANPRRITEARSQRGQDLCWLLNSSTKFQWLKSPK